jgi:hypothetical protein
MSKLLVQQLHDANPQHLERNIGSECNAFLDKLIDLLRANRHLAYRVCKTAGETGKVIPFGFQPRDVVGLDGKTYHCVGLSHDAVWCDGNLYDVIGSANHTEAPIFDSRGERIKGVPRWDAIPEHHWRPNNPPLRSPAVIVQPRPKVLPKGEAFAKLQALNAFYQAPEGLQRPGGLVIHDSEGRSVADMEAIAQWFYQIVVDGVPLEDVFTQIRASHEWQSKHPQ